MRPFDLMERMTYSPVSPPIDFAGIGEKDLQTDDDIFEARRRLGEIINLQERNGIVNRDQALNFRESMRNIENDLDNSRAKDSLGLSLARKVAPSVLGFGLGVASKKTDLGLGLGPASRSLDLGNFNDTARNMAATRTRQSIVGTRNALIAARNGDESIGKRVVQRSSGSSL